MDTHPTAMETSSPKKTTEDDETKSHYFYYYGKIREQQNMLQDVVRMNSYYAAIARNSEDFKGKVVLDVGTGTGVLAMFAAKAGARKVYAVEASQAAVTARKLIAANGLSDQIEVLQSRIEDVNLPEQVDIIVSEPMGVALVHERMLESYILARKFLKKDGLMFPCTGTIFAAPFCDETLYKMQSAKALFWSQSSYYDINWQCLSGQAARDHTSQPVVGLFQPSALLANIDKATKHKLDFRTITQAELKNFSLSLDCPINRTSLMHGVAIWFDVELGDKVTLDTSPFLTATHWSQCRLLLPSPLAVNESQRISGQVTFAANKKRSFDLSVTVSLAETSIRRESKHQLHDQLYYSDPIMLSTPAPPMAVTPLLLSHPSLLPTSSQNASQAPNASSILLSDCSTQLNYAHLLSPSDRLNLQAQLQRQYIAHMNNPSTAQYQHQAAWYSPHPSAVTALSTPRDNTSHSSQTGSAVPVAQPIHH